MRKVIPKIPKSKGLFKNLPWFDMIYLTIVGAVCLLLFLSNLGVFKYIAIVAIIAFAAVTEIRSEGVSMAHGLYYRAVAATKPREYVRSDVAAGKAGGSIEALHTVEKIEDGIIYYATGVMVRLIEIPDVAFVMKDEVIQDRYEEVFGQCFNIIEPYKNVTFIKTEREIDYTEFVEDLNRRIETVRASKVFSHGEKMARIMILREKVGQYTGLAHRTFVPVYHLVVRSAKADELAAITDQIISALAAADIKAYAATTKNVAKALAAQYFRDVAPTSSEQDLIAVAELLPQKITVGAKSLDIDGKKITTYAINSLPGSVANAWLAELTNLPNVNVTVNVAHADAHKLIKKIDRVYFETGSEAEQTARLSESVAKNSQQNSMENLVEDVEYAQDKLCEIEILVSFENADAATEKEINKHIMDLKMKRSVNKYLQLENFVNTLVGSSNKPIKRNRYIFTTKLIGMAFPMIFPNILEPQGDLIGYNDCGVPVSLDWHARDGLRRVNSNMCVFGKSGGGKSFFLKLYLLLRAASGDACIIVDVESEYLPIAQYLGGAVVDMSKSDFRINPLQPFSLTEDGKNSVSDHILVVEEFFKVLYPDISMEQRILIRELLAGLYSEFGLSDGIDVRGIAPDRFPTLRDLYAFLSANLAAVEDSSVKIMDEYGRADNRDKKSNGIINDEYVKAEMIRLRLVLRSLLSGATAKLWDGHSVLNIDNSFVVFNVQTLLASGNIDVVNAQMNLLSRYINAQLIENYKKISAGGEYRRIIVLIDEVHRLLSPEMTVTIDLCAWLAKQCRKYEGALITASQAVIDLMATEDLKSKTKAVLTESQINILFGAKSTHIADITQVYSHANLSQMELDSLREAPRGRALFMASDIMRMNTTISANALEYELCARKIDQL